MLSPGMVLRCLGAVALGSVAATTCFAETVTIEKESALRTEPSFGSATSATLKQGTRAELVAKRGIWVNLKAGDASGWVFSFNVRYSSEGATAPGGGRFVAPRGSTSVTSTIGIRGLSKEDLQKAAFNANEMGSLDGYVAGREAASEQARASGLQPVRVDYFDGASK